MANEIKRDAVREAARELEERLGDSAAGLAVLYDGGERPACTVPEDLERLLRSFLRRLGAGSETGATREFFVRRIKTDTHTFSFYIYRNGAVNIHRGSELIAAADLGQARGEIEEAAFAVFVRRFLDSLVLFL